MNNETVLSFSESNSITAKASPKQEVRWVPDSGYIFIYHRDAITDGPLVLDLYTLKTTSRILREIAEVNEQAPELLSNFIRALDFVLLNTFRRSLRELCASKNGYALNWDTSLLALNQ